MVMMLHLCLWCMDGGGERSSMYRGPESRATYYLERDAVVDD